MVSGSLPRHSRYRQAGRHGQAMAPMAWHQAMAGHAHTMYIHMGRKGPNASQVGAVTHIQYNITIKYQQTKCQINVK